MEVLTTNKKVYGKKKKERDLEKGTTILKKNSWRNTTCSQGLLRSHGQDSVLPAVESTQVSGPAQSPEADCQSRQSLTQEQRRINGEG